MIQPFKSITLEFKGKASSGMVEKSGTAIDVGGKNIDPIKREFISGVNGAVKLDGTTQGEEHTIGMASASTDQVVGILMEGFTHEHMGSEVMVGGIVNMIAGADGIQPGDPVGVNSNGKIQKQSTGKDKYFGIALTSGAKTGDSVDVLLQIGGLTV